MRSAGGLKYERLKANGTGLRDEDIAALVFAHEDTPTVLPRVAGAGFSLQSGFVGHVCRLGAGGRIRFGATISRPSGDGESGAGEAANLRTIAFTEDCVITWALTAHSKTPVRPAHTACDL